MWTDQRALPRTESRFNKDNDPNVYFCTDTERSDHSTECACIGDISFRVSRLEAIKTLALS